MTEITLAEATELKKMAERQIADTIREIMEGMESVGLLVTSISLQTETLEEGMSGRITSSLVTSVDLELVDTNSGVKLSDRSGEGDFNWTLTKGVE